MRTIVLLGRCVGLRIAALFFLAALACQLLVGCARIPRTEQLVSGGNGAGDVRADGACDTAILSVNAYPGPAEQRLDPDRIAILDWNVYKGQRPGWQEDLRRFGKEKDILFLQEAPLNLPLRQVLRQHNLHWVLNSAFSYKGVETGVLLASAIQPLGSCGLRHGEPIIGVPKTILISRYGIDGESEDLLAANIHGINIALGVVNYRKQFDALFAIVEHHRGPLILAGDFNNWSKERNAVMDLLATRLSLRALAFDDEGRTRFFGVPVDHILYRGLDPVAYAIHPVTSSDHNPISVTFRLAREKGLRRSKPLVMP